MELLTKVNQIVSRITKLLIGITLLLAVVLLTLNVILRYFFGYSIIWAEEIVRYAFIWIVFLSSALLSREASHISMEAVYNFLPTSVKNFLHLFWNVLMLAVAIILLTATWKLLGMMQMTNQLSPAGKIPMSIVYLVFPISLAGMILGVLEDSLNLLTGRNLDLTHDKDLQI